MKNVIIIGGGASGMAAAVMASQNGYACTLLEQNDRLGKKLFITGKGRCNLTNYSDVDVLIENTVTNPQFLYSAYYSFDSNATVEFFEALGLKTVVERGNRVYPASGKSGDVIKVLEKALHKHNVDIRLNTRVKDIFVEDGKVVGVLADREYRADRVIICTGGLSYQSTGATGDGYRFAKKTGHRVTKLYPSLVGLKTKQKFGLEGLSLKNTAIEVFVDGKKVYKDFGEMLFTHEGISGPMILSSSCFITRHIGKNIQIKLDLKPALSEKELDNRILRDFRACINKDFKNSLSELLPHKLIDVIIRMSGISPNKKVNAITKEERGCLVMIIKGFCMEIVDTMMFNEAVVTCGGVCVDDINPTTMESRIVEGMFFAGEVIDVDAFTGGFNLQIAFSTAFLAAANLI